MNTSRKFFILIAIGIAATSALLLASSKKPKQPYLTVVGPVQMADGIGRQAAELIDMLKDDLAIGFKSSDKNSNMEGTPEGIRSILKNKKRPLGKVVLYEDYLRMGESPLRNALTHFNNSKSLRIAYSMFESSLIPPEWVITLNHYFDAIAVPDKFLIDSYKNSGVTIPIFELPLGLNLDKFLQAPLKSKKKSPLVFANLSSAIVRKNHLKLIRAFHEAFGNSTDVQLKLNCRCGERECIEAIKKELENLGSANIEFTEICMGQNLYFNTFQTIDCYVSLSAGEGYSIQPREAMALGIPVIITDNTGQATICNSGLGRAVPSPNPISAFYPAFNNHYGVFYDCDIKDAALALQDVYNHYDHYLEQGPAARAWVKQCSYDQLKPLYLGLIKPKKIVLGAINKITPDCLFTDSEELCEKFKKLVGISFEDHRKI